MYITSKLGRKGAFQLRNCSQSVKFYFQLTEYADEAQLIFTYHYCFS